MLLRSFAKRVKPVVGLGFGSCHGVRTVQIGRDLISSGDSDQLRSVYVGNISYDVVERELAAAFSVCGKVSRVNLPFDVNENRYKGFGFVTFNEPNAAESAKKMLSDVVLKGRALTVRDVHKKGAAAPLTLQQARPWHSLDTGKSNLEEDNSVSFNEIFAGRRVALFGVVAPFTGICTDVHLPGYVALAPEFAEKVDELVCMSVTDPYTLDAWVKSIGAESSPITFLADNGSVSKYLGVIRSKHDVSLGLRCTRFSMLVDDGKVIVYSEAENATEDAQWLLDRC